MDIKKSTNILSINRTMGRPKGSKNTPKRTLDLRDYIPPPPPKFKITSSQRKLLKSFNPEALLDFRTKQFKRLPYNAKKSDLLQELSNAKEKRTNEKLIKKIEKTKLKRRKTYIGDINFEYKLYMKHSFRMEHKKMITNHEGDRVGVIQNWVFNSIQKFENAKGYLNIRQYKENYFIKFCKINRLNINDFRNYNEELGKYVYVDEQIYKAEQIIYNNYYNNYDFQNTYKEEYNPQKLNETSEKDGWDKLAYYLYNINTTYYMENLPIKLIDIFIEHIVIQSIRDLMKASDNEDYIYINPKTIINNINNNQQIKKDLKEIKMKDACSYNYEGYEEQDWDTKKGKCVFDYIRNKFGNLKGLKIACNEDNLIKIFNDKDAIINGVDTYQIYNFCTMYNIAYYAYDEDYNLFDYYYPKKNNYPSMMYKIINNHFYPIPEGKRRALVNKKVGLDIHSNLYNVDEKKIEEEINIIKLEETENIFTKLTEVMKENKKIPSISMYAGKITEIKINNEKHIFRNNDDMIKNIVSNMDIDYKGQTLGEIINIIIGDKIKTSSPNMNIYNQLLEAKKNRSFNGLIKNRIKNNEECNNIIAYDINKCYSSIMYKPIEEWILLDVDNDWEDFIGEEIKLGLYYIKTNNDILFKGNNIYSSAIVKKGLDENLISRFNIMKVLYANKKQDKNLFIDIIDEILRLSNGDKEIYKFMINYISGLLGKNKITYSKGHINKSLEQIYNTIHNYKEQDNNITPFINKINDEYYLYGFNKDKKIYDINIPMYIQILDQANIKLYDMIKKADGELIGRKVDCAIIKNPKNKLICGDKWGDYRISSIPNLNNYEVNNNIKYIEEEEFKLYDNIIDSNDYEKIKDICVNKGGCLMTGSAGTGKSYVINEISKKLNCAKITPTNKSALNIRGQTIHKFLKINKDGKIPKSTIEKIKNKKYDLIIIDEISMINKDLWRILLLLKDETKINFLLVGDNKQLPPIEDDGIERDYLNSSIVKHLINYNKIDLKIKKRYDENLSKILDDIDNIDKKDFVTRCETKINICFLNKTRKEVNKYWNNKEKNNNSLFIKADDEDEMTQDIYLYSGLPLIARRNTQGGKEMINNEKFILDGYDNEYLYLSSERPNEEGESFKHKIDIKFNDIHKYFLLNYCSTTHKAQGETIRENFTIYDFNLMSNKCKYTALSRAKSAEQIIINGEIIPNKKIVEQKPIIKDNNNIVISHHKERKEKNETEYYLYEYNNMIRELNNYELNYYENYKISNLLNIINEKYYKYIYKKYNIIVVDDEISLHQYFLFINKTDYAFKLINKFDYNLHIKYRFITFHLNYNIEKMEEFRNYLEKL